LQLRYELEAAEPLTAHCDLKNAGANASANAAVLTSDASGVGAPDGAPGAPSLVGKAALVSRGRGAFSDKIDRCAAAGACAIVVMNDEPERPDSVFR